MNNLGGLSKKGGPTWSREFDLLIRAIGECKSKAEEDAIIAREVEVLKPRLKDAKMDKRSLKEVLVRLMYVEMLGHDASWGHVKALQACSDTNLLTKKARVDVYRHRHSEKAGLKLSPAAGDKCLSMQVAYLASGLFLDYRSDLIILVVNTLTQDLKSDNYLVGAQSLHACHVPLHAQQVLAHPASDAVKFHPTHRDDAMHASCSVHGAGGGVQADWPGPGQRGAASGAGPDEPPARPGAQEGHHGAAPLPAAGPHA